jgi:hypothetical protein
LRPAKLFAVASSGNPSPKGPKTSGARAWKSNSVAIFLARHQLFQSRASHPSARQPRVDRGVQTLSLALLIKQEIYVVCLINPQLPNSKSSEPIFLQRSFRSPSASTDTVVAAATLAPDQAHAFLAFISLVFCALSAHSDFVVAQKISD